MKRIVETRGAPPAIGPYSQAVIHEGRLLFTAGQIGLDPESGQLVPGGIEAQTERVMENIRAVLEGGLSSFDRVLKTTIFLTDIRNFETVNRIYAGYFGDKPPARSTVQVAALPKGALIEVECVASTV